MDFDSISTALLTAIVKCSRYYQYEMWMKASQDEGSHLPKGINAGFKHSVVSAPEAATALNWMLISRVHVTQHITAYALSPVLGRLEK
jgi:hypothetical protein